MTTPSRSSFLDSSAARPQRTRTELETAERVAEVVGVPGADVPPPLLLATGLLVPIGIVDISMSR